MIFLAWTVYFALITCVGFIFLYSVAQVSLAARLNSRIKKHQKNKINAVVQSEDNLPRVTVQLPIKNEFYVVKRLIEAVVKLDYPRQKLQIQILDDSDDETIGIIDKAVNNHKKIKIDVLRRSKNEGYKAGALKEALKTATGEYIAIFDADFVPPKDFLRKSLIYFTDDNKLGLVQTRWTHINQNYSIFTKIQAFGLNGHFLVEQNSRFMGKYYTHFNGTAGIWKKTCILDAGNWSADTLTEDLDLSYRAQIKGWKIHYQNDILCPAELPVSLNDIRNQQYRWNKGSAEVSKKLLWKVLLATANWKKRFHALFHLNNTAIFLFFILTGLLSAPLMLFDKLLPQYNLWILAGLLYVSFVNFIIFYWIAYRYQKKVNLSMITKFIVQYTQFISFMMGMSIHNSVAVLEAYVGKKSLFLRTPKYNLQSKQDRCKNKKYHSKELPKVIYLEALFCMYFIGLTYFGISIDYWSFVIFHSMLGLAYGWIFTVSLLHTYN